MVAKGAFCVFVEHDDHPDGNRKVESEEGGVTMKQWIGIPLALLLIVGLHASAWANSELHTGGRLFFPLWDVSTPNRLTFIIITRQAMREGASIVQSRTQWRVSGDPGKCLPRGAGGSTTNVNRTDLGTAADPVFVDDVHFEYYGKSCIGASEIVHMSCADTDLFLLSSAAPRPGFINVVAGAGDLRGALDVHLITNDTADLRQRKLENSLMGHAVIADPTEGWTASYDAAAAKAVPCSDCANIDGGTAVGYENYPREVYLPFALADGSPPLGGGGAIQNSLALWAPSFMPGAVMPDNFHVETKWWDGRERAFVRDRATHAIIEELKVFDSRFQVANFVCGHTANPNVAENDGFPRLDTEPGFCSAKDVADSSHKSDNFEVLGAALQPSTPMGWWRFVLVADGAPPPLNGPNFVGSGRGLVGVVLSSTSGSDATDNLTSGMGYATRLWHEDSCEIAQSGDTIGPPHKGHGQISDENVALFNTFSSFRQSILCGLIRLQPFPLNFPGGTFEPPR